MKKNRFFRLRDRHVDGARREDQLPLADVQRDRQRDRKTARRRKDYSYHGMVGKEDWIGKLQL